MKIWQVLLVGEGFTRNGSACDCEISGFVEAAAVDAAVEEAVAIARKTYPELAQASGQFPRPVINADEVVELGADFPFPST
jgi:hypothetical protein